MRIFINGNITGENYREAYEKYARAENDLKEAGYTVVNPLRSISQYAPHRERTQELIKQAMDCDTLYMLDGWDRSDTGRIIFLITNKLNYQQFSERDFLHLITRRGILKTGSCREL